MVYFKKIHISRQILNTLEYMPMRERKMEVMGMG